MVSLEQIHELDDFITQTRIRHRLRPTRVMYLKKEFVFKGGTWDGGQFLPLRKRRDQGKVLVLGESDKEFSYLDFVRMRAIGGYSAIWSTHIAASAVPGGVHALPLGLPYDSDYPFPFTVLGDITILREAFASSKSPGLSDIAIFGAFAEGTDASRATARREIEKSPIGRWETFPATNPESHKAYLVGMRESGLVACPRGVGIDTYRFWEAIYMGAIPVILNPPARLKRAIAGLPHLALRDWSELSNVRKIRTKVEQTLGSDPDYRNASLKCILKSILSSETGLSLS